MSLQLEKITREKESIQAERAQSFIDSRASASTPLWNPSMIQPPESDSGRSPSVLFPQQELSTFKQKELSMKIDQLTALLTESEAAVQRLQEQEKVGCLNTKPNF